MLTDWSCWYSWVSYSRHSCVLYSIQPHLNVAFRWKSDRMAQAFLCKERGLTWVISCSLRNLLPCTSLCSSGTSGVMRGLKGYNRRKEIWGLGVWGAVLLAEALRILPTFSAPVTSEFGHNLNPKAQETTDRAIRGCIKPQGEYDSTLPEEISLH